MEYFDHVGISYDGDKVNDEPHGFGQMTMQDGSRYTETSLAANFTEMANWSLRAEA